MEICFADARFEADGATMLRDPFGAGRSVTVVLRLGGDAGKADKIRKIADEPRLVLLQVSFNCLHCSQYGREKLGRKAKLRSNDSVKISIIVPAFNEERLLGESLQHISAAMRIWMQRGWATELIVCDNNSTDRTAEIARVAGAIVVFEPVNQIARARNTGAGIATGDWLVFVDADSHPSAELFAEVADQIVSGKCIAGGATMQLAHPIANITAGLWNIISRAAHWLAGSFIFCEAEAFRAIGGFSNELFVSEEIELSKRLKTYARKQGKKIVILHRHPLKTSDRKVRLYTLREQARFMFRLLLGRGKVLADRDACHPWYDGRR